MSFHRGMTTDMLQRLVAVGDEAPPLEEKLSMLQGMRAAMPDVTDRVDRFLLEHQSQLRRALAEARQNQGKLQELIDRALAPPWHPAKFLRLVSMPDGLRAMVAHGRNCRLVSIAEDVDQSLLRLGDDVLLTAEMNLLFCAAPEVARTCGETATFQRRGGDGSLILKTHEDEVVVEAAAVLAEADLAPGDLVRWDSSVLLAYQRLDRDDHRQHLSADVPTITRDQIGGQAHNVQRLLSLLTARFIAPERAAAYGIDGKKAALLVGPPGVGKTLLAKLAVAELSRRSGRTYKFAVVKPGEWEDPFVGVTQKNMRQTFAAFGDGPGILFLDEIEAVTRIRGSFAGRHADLFLSALLAEWDGFVDRGDVTILAATNRKELIDPGVQSRFSTEIEVRRPDVQGAREIFNIHLPAQRPFSPNGSLAIKSREEIVAAAVTRLYAPTDESAVCVLRFRNGSSRTVHARELLSGREISHICQTACQLAFEREVIDQADPGLALCDMDQAVTAAIERLATTLSRGNAHWYLHDLPQDVEVVSVEPVARKVKRSLHYVNIESGD